MKVITPDDISLRDALPSVDLFLAGRYHELSRLADRGDKAAG